MCNILILNFHTILSRNLKTLWLYLHNKGVNTHRIWDAVKDIAIKAILWYVSTSSSATKKFLFDRCNQNDLMKDSLKPIHSIIFKCDVTCQRLFVDQLGSSQHGNLCPFHSR